MIIISTLIGGSVALWKRNRTKSLIDYAEQESRILADFQLKCLSEQYRTSTSFMNILLGGALVALALAVHLHDSGVYDCLALGAILMSLYWFAIAAVVLWKCVKSTDLYPIANDPAHLYSDVTMIPNVRYSDLENRQKSIDLNRARRHHVGFWLDVTRSAAIFTPFIFLVCYG